MCLATGGPTQTYAVVTDASGFFTVSVTSLISGTYNWREKGFRTLANSGTLVLAGGNTSQEMGAQRGGDATNDNLVSAPDFNALKTSFGKSPGDPGYDVRTDFDNSGPVGASDFNILKGTFGQAGAAVICP